MTVKKLTTDALLDKPLPGNIDAEKLILAQILIDDSRYVTVTGALVEESFALAAHRTIWKRMSEMAERTEKIDRVTLANELIRYGELEAIGGLSYLVSMDEGMPVLADINSYVKIVVEKWRLRKIVYAANSALNRAMDQTGTADEISQDAQARFSEDIGGYGSSQIESVSDYVENYPGGVNMMLSPEKWDKGTPTGFRDIDDWTDGFHASEIYLIGARPGNGKTAFASNVAKNVARGGTGVAIFSLELNKQMLMGRMFCEEAYIAYSRWRRGELTETERNRLRVAMQTVKELPLYIDDSMKLTVADIRVKLNKILRKKPVGLMVVDYAQLIRGKKGVRFNNENDRITSICEDLKDLTKQTGIPLLLLSQLNRESEKEKGDARPKLSQARGGGALEEVAYVGAVIFREYNKKRDRNDLRYISEFILEKNRSGQIGTVMLRFVDYIMRFENGGDPAYTPVMAA